MLVSPYEPPAPKACAPARRQQAERRHSARTADTNSELAVRSFGCGPRSGLPLSRFHVVLGGGREYADEESQTLRRQVNLLQQISRSALAGAVARGTRTLLGSQISVPTDTTECLSAWCWLVFEVAWRGHDETLRAEKAYYADVKLQDPLRDVMACFAAFDGTPVELRAQGLTGTLAAPATWVETRPPQDLETEVRRRLAALPGIEIQQQIGCWYSVLPDLAFASAAACRILLATTDAEDPPLQEAVAKVPADGSSEKPPGKTPFIGGELELFEDRAELCGVHLCVGERSARKRRLLQVLSKKTSEGQFVAHSARELGEMLAIGEDAIAGLVRGIRDEITESLAAGAGLLCERDSVILSGGPGYRLAETIVVCTKCPSVQSRARTRRRGTDGDDTNRHDTNDTNRDTNDTDRRDTNDTNREAAPVGPQGRANQVEAASPEVRRGWILDQLGAGQEVRVSDVEQRFDCSNSTALRDFDALKALGQIEFRGSSRSGYYCLKDADGS